MPRDAFAQPWRSGSRSHHLLIKEDPRTHAWTSVIVQMMAPMTVHDGSAALLDHVEPATVMAGAPFQAFKPRQDAKVGTLGNLEIYYC